MDQRIKELEIDRWSYADLKTYLESLSNSVLDHQLLSIVLVREQQAQLSTLNRQTPCLMPMFRSSRSLHLVCRCFTWNLLTHGCRGWRRWSCTWYGFSSCLQVAAPYPLITSTNPEAAVDAALSKSKLNIFNSVLYRKDTTQP